MSNYVWRSKRIYKRLASIPGRQGRNGTSIVRIGICEENQAAREQLRYWILQVCELYGIEPELAAYAGENTLLDAMRLRRFDLIFLSRDGPAGFLSVRQLREKDPKVKLVFLTDTTQYAVMGVRLHLTDYIVKPAEFKHMVRALKLAGVGNGR